MAPVPIKTFVSTIAKKRKPLPEYLNNLINYINQSHKLISDFKIDKDVTETPKEILDLINTTIQYGDYIVAFSKNVNEYKPVYCAIPQETLTKDLEFIRDNSVKESFVIDDYGNSITFVKEIIMNDVHRDIKHNFGFFKMIMYDNYVKMVKQANNSERNGRYHPYHTPEDKLCLGTYLGPYQIAMRSNNFYAAYSLVLHCLTVYGGDDLKGRSEGPQNPIELWIGQVCSVCDSSVPIDEISVCGKTNRAICPNCIDSLSCTDEINGEIYHPDVLKSCSVCNKLTSTVIRKVCLGCREKKLMESLS